jgi:DNA polymerase elongation subunit (family B)
MVIDYSQKSDGIDISFVNDKNQIEIITAPLKFGYYKYVACESFDNGVLPNLLSFKNKSHIKRETTKYFNNHNINEFFNFELKNEQPEIYKKTSKLLMPNPFSVDIETDITDEYGYSTPEKAENKILSISITDINLGSIFFQLKNPNKPELNDNDFESIKNMVLTSLGAHKDKYSYDFKIRTFDSEIEMLNIFLELIEKYFHSIIGWNFTLFDWVYIYNRCKRLGIDIKKASPIHKINKKKFTLKDKTEINVDFPAHRIIIDYMQLFKDSLIYNSLDSYALNNIADLILGLKKIMYDGNLRTLYRENPNKFIAYALIDTILVMLVHKSTNLYDVDFFESYFNGVAYLKISQNSISEALIYNELRNENIFFLESEFNNTIKRPYQGGYVKAPTKKIINFGAGLDFSGLYPNSMITNGISPENKIDFIKMNIEKGRPFDEIEEKKWLQYRELGYVLCPRGQIYDNNSDGVFVRVEKKLIAQRKIFKSHAEDIYLNIIPKLENIIKQKSINT